jgi:hypothetical protein
VIPQNPYVAKFMITLFHVLVLVLVGFGVLSPPFVVIIPWAYIWLMGRGLIKGGANIRVEDLTELLAHRWRHPQALAEYMKRYWMALQYSSSATARQHTCTSLALVQILSGIVVFWKASVVYGLLALIEGVMLWVMATRVNRPLSMYKDVTVRNSDASFCRSEWRNGIAALIAYAELHPENPNAKYIAMHLMSDEFVMQEMSVMRTSSFFS